MKILIAEDESEIVMQYKKVLEYRKHQVVVAHDGEECLKAYKDSLKLKDPKSVSTFDAVILDYRMPNKDGMEVAKEILAINPHQRIIFASAYVKDTLLDSVKQLKRVVELMQKPFGLDVLVDAIEDKEIYTGLEELNVKVHEINDLDPTHEQIRELLEGLKKIQKTDIWYTVGDTVFA